MSGTTAIPVTEHMSPMEKKSSDSAAVDAVLDQYEGLKLADTQEIDEFFLWPEGTRPDIAHDKFDYEIPVLDLSPLHKLEALRKEQSEQGKTSRAKGDIEGEIKACEAAIAGVERGIRDACEEYGFFQIVNHGVPQDIVDLYIESCRQLFDKPLEEKMKVKEEFYPDKLSKTGYNQMKRSNAFSTHNNCHVYNEAFDVETPEILYPDRLKEITGILYPEEPESSKQGLELSSSGEELGKQLSKLTLLLLDRMASSLGLPKGCMNGLLGELQDNQVYARLRVNHYPLCAQPDKTWGMFGHTDTSIITILHQDTVGGLQIRFKDGSWHGVRPIPGALVVNVGDFLQVFTNRRFLSAEHRAVANEKSDRFSIAYFVYNQGDTVISPRPELVDSEHPLRYKTFMQLEYFKELLTRGVGKDRDQFLDGVFGTGAKPHAEK